MNASPGSQESVTLLTRRELLKGLLASWTAACALPRQVALAGSQSSVGPCPVWLPRITGQRDAVLRFGNAYLEAHAGERDAERLLGLVGQGLGSLKAENSNQPEDATEMIAALKRVVRDEYVLDRVTLLHEWMISVTEARLYALVAMFHNA